MSINVSTLSKDYDFEIWGCSYIGKPKNNTVMYLTKKIEKQVLNLEKMENCLVFIEDNVLVPDELKRVNCFISTSNPQLDYTRFVSTLSEQKEQNDRSRQITMTESGYYLGENVKLGDNCYIEPNCLIGHDVSIGDNARIYFGTVIKNATIGDNLIANEHSVIGAYAFTMAHDEEKNLIRIPTLGGVRLGSNVEIGALNNISCGSAGDTVLQDNVKLDAFVHVGHDVSIDNNVEIPAGVVISGFVNIGSDVFIGVNASLRNRINIGTNAIIGMGAVVTKDVAESTIVVGNPAKPLDHK